ncbi:hypothetical protein Q0F98_29440 [Paenibacillus amylolyticus]|nr:hypothetical protein Q0F98_29440 [Paenibacillus amylolyticus]
MTRLVLTKIVNEMVEEKRESLENDLILNLLSIVNNGYSHFQELIKIGIIFITQDSNEIKYISICNNALMKYIYCYEISKWHTKSMIDLIQPFNTYINDEYLRQFLILFISFKQSQFKKERDIWSEAYSKSDQPLCISCNEIIEAKSAVTIVLWIDKTNFSNENLGSFHIIHEKCAWNGPSIMDVRPEKKHAILNCDDFLSFYKIIRLFKSMPNSQMAQAVQRSKKEKLKRSPHFKFLPSITSKGESFWAIMEFLDDVNTGIMNSRKINGVDHLLFLILKRRLNSISQVIQLM